MNLLGNALKFTERGSIQIVSRVASDKAGSRHLEFEVRDTGPGIAPDRASAIFEAFTQEDSSISRRHGGTGLGLTISRRLAELMDGTLRMTSQLGQGTVFTLRIPLLLNQQTAAVAPGKGAPSVGVDSTFAKGHPLRVLLVEDDNTNFKLMTLVLTQLGYEPLTARNGAEAVTTYTSERPDCVLMDLQMPEMDGVEATRAIRKFEEDEGLRPAFISALTANTMPETLKRCLTGGMNAHLSKPIKRRAIVDNLIEAVEFLRQAV